MAASNPLFIDDDDLFALGFRVKATTGLDGSNPSVPPTLSLPGLTDIDASTVGTPAPRKFTATLLYKTSSQSALETAMHVVREKLDSKEVKFRHVMRSNQQLIARCRNFTVDYGRGPRTLPPFLWTSTLEFNANDPDWQDTDAVVTAGMPITLTTSPVALPQGTDWCKPVITFVASGGSLVNPTFIYKSSAAATLVTLAPVITLATGDAWECDVLAQTVRKRVSGVWTDARSTLPINTVFPIFSPKDGVYGTASWPTGQGSGTHFSGTVSYRRRWK